MEYLVHKGEKMENEELMVADINCTTGEVVERPYTTEEIAEREAMLIEENAKKEANRLEAVRIAALKASAKAKLIAGQPLTAEEADTLVI